MHDHQSSQPYLTFKCQIRHRSFRQAGTFPHKFHLQFVTIYAYTALQCSWQQCQVHSESDAILILTWNSILIEYSFLQCDFYWMQKGKWFSTRKDKKVKKRPTYIDRAPHAWWKYKSSKPPKFGNPRANRYATLENWAIACTPSEFSTLCSRIKWTGVR